MDTIAGAHTPPRSSTIPDGPPGMPATVVDFYRDCFQRHADKQAVTCALPNGMAATLTYAELDRASDAVAAWLREEVGLPPGSMVAIQVPNALAFPVISTGIMKAGLVPTAVNPLYTVREVAHQLTAADAKALFVLDALAGELEAVLKQTGPMPVVTVSVAEFFPRLKAMLVDAVLRYGKKMLPPVTVPHQRFRDVLASGRAHADRVGAAGLRAYASGVDPDGMVGCWFTGGTTGRSKGVVQTHRGLLASVGQLVDHLGGPWDAHPMRTLLVLPLYHVFGVGMMMQAAAQGGHVILIPNPRPLTNLQKAVEAFKPTYLPGVPTLFANLLNQDWFLPSARAHLKMCLSGAAPLAPATQARWREAVGQPIHELYGMTECGLATCTPLDGGDYTGSIGRALPNIDARVVDGDGNDVPDGTPGQLILRGPQVMRGYLNQPEETARSLRDGWLHTGDIVTRDADGLLRIVDRAKDMVIVSGFNVYPSEVEAVITDHPGVLECAVIGVPDGEAGERVKAFVVARDPALSVEELRRHCKEQLTPYKLPKEIELVPDLPKSPVGKILRRELRQRA